MVTHPNNQGCFKYVYRIKWGSEKVHFFLESLLVNVAVFEDGETGTENSKTISTEPGRKNLPHSIGLKQLGRSIKYMTAAEKREEQKKKGKNMKSMVSPFN